MVIDLFVSSFIPYTTRQRDSDIFSKMGDMPFWFVVEANGRTRIL